MPGLTPLHTHPMRVLIADDDPTTRRMLGASLRLWHYQPSEASSGDEAWTLLTAPDPPPLALLDWTMPGITGPEICRRLKTRSPETCPYLILVSARDRFSDIADGLDSGADDYVRKPYNPVELRARVDGGRRLVDLRLQLLDANARLEDRVRQRTREVERLLRWDEELLHHLGHDLRTPLTPLVSLLPLLHDTESDPERRRLLELALEGARSIQAISAGVAELCQATATALTRNPRPLELRPLVEATLEQARLSHPDAHRRLLNRVSPEHRIHADPLHFRCTLDRLLANAIRFTAENGLVAIDSASDPQGITLSVRDDGIGLDPAQFARLFEPFQKVDPSRHDRTSLGLGLAIARIFVEQHGGRIWAESDGPGRGATFHSLWPAPPLSPAQPPPP